MSTAGMTLFFFFLFEWGRERVSEFGVAWKKKIWWICGTLLKTENLRRKGQRGGTITSYSRAKDGEALKQEWAV